MSMIEEMYPAIHFGRLKSIVLNWAKDDTLIKRVSLYLNSRPEPPLYILVAELPPFPREKRKARQEFRLRYREKNNGVWPETDHHPSKLYPRDLRYTGDEEAVLNTDASTLRDCLHLFHWLPQVYKGSPPDNYRKEWQWINVGTEEELYELSVRQDTKYIVYEKDDGAKEDRPLLAAEDYIRMRKSEGASKGQIAVELFDKEGSYRITDVRIGRLLGMDNGLGEAQIAALKMRVQRARRKSQKTTSNKS
ncbi:MAG: hypothetical protein JXB23_17270 [Candidatus Aminicenantes bacterium]|nr:hypothetical protein [Candidatus Aminicenantes bacterium]